MRKLREDHLARNQAEGEPPSEAPNPRQSGFSCYVLPTIVPVSRWLHDVPSVAANPGHLGGSVG